MSRPSNIVVVCETTENKNKNKNKKYIETSNKTAKLKAKDDSFIDNSLLSPFDIPSFLF